MMIPARADVDAGALPLVSLVVVTYNSAPLLPAFFAALAATTYPAYEVVVVDNASRDTTLRYLDETQPGVKTLVSTTNRGFGPACNQGAEVARGDLLVFLNPDVTVTPDWLTLLVAHSAAHPEVGILCPVTLYPGEAPEFTTEVLRETASVPGAAMMVRRAAWRALGGFDKQIFLYWEDTEFCWRAWRMGWRVASDMQAVVYHRRGGSAGGMDWDAQRIKNSLYTYLKLMRWRRVLPFAAVLACKTVVKFALRPRRDLLGAWLWNAAHLPETLAARRRLARGRGIAPAQLEQMIDAHAREQARQRRAGRGPRAAAAA